MRKTLAKHHALGSSAPSVPNAFILNQLTRKFQEEKLRGEEVGHTFSARPIHSVRARMCTSSAASGTWS